jgi:hypothetical protein
MNIYQNGAFSEILHKLTKYQALAASAKNFSKQGIYLQKIQEYRNKLDKINYTQSGGMGEEQDKKKQEIINKINDLIQSNNNWKQNYKTVKDAHNSLIQKVNFIEESVKRTIDEYTRLLTANQLPQVDMSKDNIEQELKDTRIKLKELEEKLSKLKEENKGKDEQCNKKIDKLLSDIEQTLIINSQNQYDTTETFNNTATEDALKKLQQLYESTTSV